MLKYIQDYVNTLPKEANLKKEDKVFSVDIFLTQVELNNYKLKDIACFEVLSKKIEVGRRLYRYYTLNDFKKIGEEFIPQTSFYLLICHYICLFLFTYDWRYVNTLLKILDGVLIFPHIDIPCELKIICKEFIKDVL